MCKSAEYSFYTCAHVVKYSLYKYIGTRNRRLRHALFPPIMAATQLLLSPHGHVYMHIVYAVTSF